MKKDNKKNIRKDSNKIESKKYKEAVSKIKKDNKDKIVNVNVDEKKKDIVIEESSIRKIGCYLIKKIKEYKYIFLLDFVIFLLLFFLIPTIILEVKAIIWMLLFLAFTILPTIVCYFNNLFKRNQIILGLPFFYLCILCILDRCTIKDLYGITSHGTLDKTPAWVDAIFVTFIIVFFQYIGLIIIKFIKKCFKERRTKK